jgi:HK97 family phage prohead protease
MESNKREVRTMTGGRWQPRLREAVEGEKESRTIEGYAIVFGVESRILADYWDNYREIIEAGAITEERLKEMDIKMTMYHNREKILARSTNGEGTLKLRVDEVGVHYEFEAPHTVDGDTALELVKRGDLSGSSFMFWTDEKSGVSYEKRSDGIMLRRVKTIGMIYDMTIAADPAYEQTTVAAREAYTHFEKSRKKEPCPVNYARERRERELIINNFNL